MPNNIDLNTLDFNESNAGFTSQYQPTVDTDPICQLPDLIDVDLTLINVVSAVSQSIVIPLPPFPPIPPVFIPIIDIPPIPCPDGNSITTTFNVSGGGAATASGSLNVTGGPCSFSLSGGIEVFVPPFPPIPCSPIIDVDISITGTGGTTVTELEPPHVIDLPNCVQQIRAAWLVHSAEGDGGTMTCSDVETKAATTILAGDKIEDPDEMQGGDWPLPGGGTQDYNELSIIQTPNALRATDGCNGTSLGVVKIFDGWQGKKTYICVEGTATLAKIWIKILE